jgi:hypothetical protein
MAKLPSRAGGPPERIPRTYRLVYEPLETLSYMAAVTGRVKLETSVIHALLHPPVVPARRFATLDQLSGGRVIAGSGRGRCRRSSRRPRGPVEARKGAGMDEAVAAMRACWGPDPVEYTGRFYRIAASEVNPKPVQERLPVLLGATPPRAPGGPGGSPTAPTRSPSRPKRCRRWPPPSARPRRRPGPSEFVYPDSTISDWGINCGSFTVAGDGSWLGVNEPAEQLFL